MIIQPERLKEHLTQGPFLQLPLATQALYLHLIANMDDEGVADIEVARRLCGADDKAIPPLYEAAFIRGGGDSLIRVLSAKFLQGGDME